MAPYFTSDQLGSELQVPKGGMVERMQQTTQGLANVEFARLIVNIPCSPSPQ